MPLDQAYPFDARNYATGAGAVSITYTAVQSSAHRFSAVAWSYATGYNGSGSLTITVDGTTVFSVDITDAGPGEMIFPYDMEGIVGKQVVITLADGGATAKLNVLGYSRS